MVAACPAEEFTMRLSDCLVFFCTALALAPQGCRRDDPPPSHHEDLGDASQPLLPTSSTWQDKRIIEGTAEFHPFREPDLVDKPNETPPPGQDSVEGGGGAPDSLQADLQAVIEDHNSVLQEGSPDKLSDFYVEAQLETVKIAASSLRSLHDKLRELAPTLPEKQTDIENLAKVLSPEGLLKLNVASIKARGAEEAAGMLEPVPAVSLLPGAPAADQVPKEVLFKLGKEDWYIESPIVAIVGQSSGPLNELIGSLDALIADTKAGSAKAADLAQRAPVLAKMLEVLPPSTDEPTPAAGEEEAGDDGGEDDGGAPDGEGDQQPEAEGGADDPD
jgi:hypothetical protein